MPYLETRIRHLLRAARNDGGKGEAINRYNSVRCCPPSPDKLEMLDHGKEKYKYTFEPAPRQNDPVIRYIIRLIRDMKVKHIGVAAMNFRVEPTDKSSPFWLALPDYTTYCSKLYTFMDRFNEFPVTAWVTFAPEMPGPTENNLHLKIGKEWVVLKDWLLSSQMPTKELVGEKGYRAQRRWWRLNGKHFRLADLPTEMRMKIFEFALGPRIYPLTTSKDAEVRLGLGFRNWLDSSSGWLGGHPQVVLLTNSAQIEAGTKPNYNWLNHLILDFTMSDWFSFFGVRVRSNFYMDSGVSLRPILPTLNGLSTLQLWFRSPEDGASYYPSGMRNVNWGVEHSFTCCQRTMADWIMTFAWPFVKDLPKVRLGGVLKKDTKDKWNKLLALPARDKIGIMDHAVEQAAILNTPPADM